MSSHSKEQQESQLHYPLAASLPAPGTVVAVAPGVHWVRMALPFALDHINLWLLRDRQDGIEGWTIVDCGIADEATKALWEQIFATALQGLPVLRVICTHMHPDHIGLAHWLTERWSTPELGDAAGAGSRECRLWISATDWNAARMASASMAEGFGGQGAARFFARHGLTDATTLDAVRSRGNLFSRMVPQVPTRYRRLLDGMVLRIGGRDWRCIAGYGHAPEHISLHAAALPGRLGDTDFSGVLIAGDMVLPRISTNVSVIDIEPEADPLPLYLRSIAALRALPADTLVLPSHGKPFTGLHERIAQLAQHHEDRYADVLAACAAQPCSAADLLMVLFQRKLDLHQTTFAMGEAVAHVHALAGVGRLRPEPGPDGVLRWATVA